MKARRYTNFEDLLLLLNSCNFTSESIAKLEVTHVYLGDYPRSLKCFLNLPVNELGILINYKESPVVLLRLKCPLSPCSVPISL